MNLRWQNWLQDFGSRYDNLSLVEINNTVQPATDSMNIEWQWALMQVDSNQVQRQVLCTTFHMEIAPVAPMLCNGVFLLELTARDPSTGRTWQNRMPVFLQHNLVENTCQPIMPVPSLLSDWQYVQQAYMHTFFAPWVRGSHFLANRPGDINGDGVVNVTDLLIVTGAFD